MTPKSIAAPLCATIISASVASGQTTPCTADLDGNGEVEAGDIGSLLIRFGPCSDTLACEGDLDASGEVDAADIGSMLISFGACAGPSWAAVLEWAPDPAVIYDSNLRADISQTHLPWRVRDNGTGIEMVLIPPGSFMMGCSPSSQYNCSVVENPLHAVSLTHAFYLGRTEVTQVQWLTKMGSNPSFTRTLPDSLTRPVEMVTWIDASRFLDAGALRFPTEAEWEFAYRAGLSSAFHGSPDRPQGTNDDSQIGTIAWTRHNIGTAGAKPVGQKPSNGFGLHDMAGNVWEWVADWLGPYGTGSQTDPSGPVSGTDRVLRGGSWSSFQDTWNCRASDRNSMTPDLRMSSGGFRAARNP